MEFEPHILGLRSQLTTAYALIKYEKYQPAHIHFLDLKYSLVCSNSDVLILVDFHCIVEWKLKCKSGCRSDLGWISNWTMANELASSTVPCGLPQTPTAKDV